MQWKRVVWDESIWDEYVEEEDPAGLLTTPPELKALQEQEARAALQQPLEDLDELLGSSVRALLLEVDDGASGPGRLERLLESLTPRQSLGPSGGSGHLYPTPPSTGGGRPGLRVSWTPLMRRSGRCLLPDSSLPPPLQLVLPVDSMKIFRESHRSPLPPAPPPSGLRPAASVDPGDPPLTSRSSLPSARWTEEPLLAEVLTSLDHDTPPKQQRRMPETTGDEEEDEVSSRPAAAGISPFVPKLDLARVRQVVVEAQRRRQGSGSPLSAASSSSALPTSRRVTDLSRQPASLEEEGNQAAALSASSFGRLLMAQPVLTPRYRPRDLTEVGLHQVEHFFGNAPKSRLSRQAGSASYATAGSPSSVYSKQEGSSSPKEVNSHPQPMWTRSR